MPLFQYDSFSRRGKRVKGTIDAVSSEAAKTLLRGQGLMPVTVVEVGVEKKGSWFKALFQHPVDIKTKVVFTKQLAVLLKSGVPLLQALELLIEQFEKRFRRILINVKDCVKSGESFASQLEKYPKVFSNVYVQLVRAGEASGKLYMILDRLTGYLEKEEETRKKIKKAMSYPIFMITFSVIIVIVLLTVLVPKMAGMLKKMGKDLPELTIFLTKISDFLLAHYFPITIVLLVFALSFAYWKSTEAGRYKLDKLFLWFPLTAYFSRMKAVVQFSKTLGMLLESGVNLSEALEIVSNVVDNTVLVTKLEGAKDKIIKEGKISRYLEETGIFPKIAIYMIKTGEQSGKLDQMLLHVGDDYDEQLKDLTDSLIAKIGPIMTIVVGLIIGFIVVAVFLPMFSGFDFKSF